MFVLSLPRNYREIFVAKQICKHRYLTVQNFRTSNIDNSLQIQNSSEMIFLL